MPFGDRRRAQARSLTQQKIGEVVVSEYRRGEHPNSRANLVPGAGAWGPGATPRLVNGLRTRRPSSAALAPIIEELEEGLLLKDADGHVPAAYRLAVEMAAVQLLAVRRGEAFLDVNGEHDEQGNVRPEVEGLAKAAARAEKALDRLGMTPMAATKLYGDLAQLQQQRPVDLATALSEPDPELRRQLLRRVPGWEDDHVN